MYSSTPITIQHLSWSIFLTASESSLSYPPLKHCSRISLTVPYSSEHKWFGDGKSPGELISLLNFRHLVCPHLYLAYTVQSGPWPHYDLRFIFTWTATFRELIVIFLWAGIQLHRKHFSQRTLPLRYDQCSLIPTAPTRLILKTMFIQIWQKLLWSMNLQLRTIYWVPKSISVKQMIDIS